MKYIIKAVNPSTTAELTQSFDTHEAAKKRAAELIGNGWAVVIYKKEG